MGINQKPTVFSRSKRLHWDGDTPPVRIEQVWNFLAIKLRQVRKGMSQVHDLFYERKDRGAFMRSVAGALKEVIGEGETARIVNVSHLEQVILKQKSVTGQSFRLSPGRQGRAIQTLEAFAEKILMVSTKLESLRASLEWDILRHIRQHCSNYVSLGISDDDFYISLRARTLSIKDILGQFDLLLKFLGEEGTDTPSMVLFSDCDFSLEISISTDCEMFPLLRIAPDLIQKLDTVLDVAQDWLRSDKVYVEQVQREIAKTRTKFTDVKGKFETVKLEYDKTFTKLKQKQSQYDDSDMTNEDLWRGLSKLEATRTRLDIDIAILDKNICVCRENMQDMGSASTRTSQSGVASGRLLSRRQSRDDVYSTRALPRDGSVAHSSYMTQLSKDADAHHTKLETLHQKRILVKKEIAEKRALLIELEANETEIHYLSKKLRNAGKLKSKCKHKLNTITSHIQNLEQLLLARLRPGSEVIRKSLTTGDHIPKTNKVHCVGVSQRHTTLKVVSCRRRMGGGGTSGGHGRSKRSAGGWNVTEEYFVWLLFCCYINDGYQGAEDRMHDFAH